MRKNCVQADSKEPNWLAQPKSCVGSATNKYGDAYVQVTPLVFGSILLAGLWMISHPYEGLRHNAILYGAQALSHVEPEIFRRDLFFAWGSQDQFTVFGRLYSVVVAQTGLAHASAIAYALGQLPWLWVAVRWARAALPVRAWIVGAACVIALRHAYSVDTLFEVGETFVTARLFAEPLTLGALLAAALGHPIASAVMIVPALLIHPLMALPGLGVIAILIVKARFNPSDVALMGTLAVALLLVAITAALGGLPRYDEQWFEIVLSRDLVAAIPSEWTYSAMVAWAAQLLLLVAASRVPGVALARVWHAVALVGLAGVLLSLVGGLARVTFVIQAQPWRSMWLVAWVAPLAILAAFFAMPVEARSRRLVALAGIPSLALLQHSWTELVAPVALVHALALLLAIEKGTLNERPLVRIAGWAWLAVLTSFALGYSAIESYVFQHWFEVQPMTSRLLRTVYITEFAWFASPLVALLCVWLWARGGRGRVAAVAISLCVLGAGARFVDGRSASSREMELLIAKGITGWQAVIPKGASVFWPEHLGNVWFVLHRQSYISRNQRAGEMFNRPMAIEGYRRAVHIAGIGKTDGAFYTGANQEPAKERRHDREDLVSACRDPVLGFVVLEPRLGRRNRAGFHRTDYR